MGRYRLKVILFVFLLAAPKTIFSDVAVGGGGWATVASVGAGNDLTGYTADSGSDRLLILCASFETDTDLPDGTMTDMTFGTTTATIGPIVHLSEPNNNRFHGIHIWFIKEADIETGSLTMTANWADAPQASENVLSIVTLTGVDQTTPITDSDSASFASGTLTATNSVTGAAGEMTIHFELHQAGGGNWTQNNGAAEGHDVTSDGGSSQHSVGYLLNHSTPSATSDGSSSRPIGMSTIVVGDVEGGATDYPRRRRRLTH